MSLRRQSKSGLFLMELILNLLLFCLLCGSALLFFTKSYHLSEDATMLNHAVQITSSLAGIYETEQEGLECITKAYPLIYKEGEDAVLYLDQSFLACKKEHSYCYITITPVADNINSVVICFYDQKDRPFYSIQACRYVPATPQTLKEVAKNE